MATITTSEKRCDICRVEVKTFAQGFEVNWLHWPQGSERCLPRRIDEVCHDCEKGILAFIENACKNDFNDLRIIPPNADD